MAHGNSSLDVKRLRRVLEPETKNWNDELLETPWEDLVPQLSKHTVFAMKNIFFFSHATAVQAAAVPRLSCVGASAVVEAPTGCGKTLAFLIPLMERMVAYGDAHVAKFHRPLLQRNIVSIIMSPSRVLAEQTFVVARNLAARFPHNLHVALCDGVMERAPAVVEHLSKVSRGAGIVLITTPNDAVSFFEAYDAFMAARRASGVAQRSTTANEVSNELLDAQDEETKQRYLKKLALKAQQTAGAAATGGAPRNAGDAGGDLLVVQSNPGSPFVIIVDEADVVLKANEMREAVLTIVRDHIFPSHTAALPPADVVVATPNNKAKGKGKGGKRGREEDAIAAAAAPAPLEKPKANVDFGLFGATAAMSTRVADFTTLMADACQTTFDRVLMRRKSADSFVSQLSNRYYLCESHAVLHTIVHLLNLHPCKKHFVFFNSTAVLLFVRNLLMTLAKGTRPVLFLKHIYAMYEEMKESTKFEEYNAFLQHTPTALASVQAAALAKKQLKEEKNPHFQSGWKRDSKPPPGTGALLLCTDVAAFGLDVRDVDYVYHFEPPASLRSYVHRIGRVGRMGMRGTSVLLLPCHAGNGQRTTAGDKASLVDRERKMDSLRFNTITNTKLQTSGIQSTPVDESCLDEAKAAYLAQLQKRHKLEQQVLPPAAPITSNIRAVIMGDPKLQALGRQAAMALCKPQRIDEGLLDPTEEAADAPVDEQATDPTATSAVSWYDPKLALEALLLD